MRDDIAEIKEGVKVINKVLISPENPEDGLVFRVVRSEEKIENMEEEGVWDAINAEQRRNPWRKAWRKTLIGTAATLATAAVFGIIKLLQFMAQVASQVGG